MKTPDKWVIVRFTSKETEVDKLLCGWYGCYMGADEWRLSSGICGVDYETVDGLVIFENLSGSLYNCFKNREGLSAYTGNILNTYSKKVNELGATIETIPYKDWKPLYV